MVKLRKPRQASSKHVDNAQAVPGEEPLKGAPLASEDRFEADSKEGELAGRGTVPKPPSGAMLPAPQKTSKEVGRRGQSGPAPSGVQLLVDKLMVPDNSLIEKRWRDYEGGNLPEEDLRALELEYQDLSAFFDGVCEDHKELRLRGLQLKEAALAPNSRGSDIVLNGLEKYDTDRVDYGERVESYEKAAEHFAVDLLPTLATLHPKRNRLKNRSIKKLNALPSLERADAAFVSAYSMFIREHGRRAGEESGLDRNMNELEIQLDFVNYTRLRLECQRAECVKALTSPLDVGALSRLLTRVNFLEKEHQAYADQRGELAREGDALVEQVRKSSEKINEAIALRKKVDVVKVKIRDQLQPFFDLIAPQNEFEKSFADLKTLVGPQEVLTNGTERACKELKDIYTDTLLTWQYIRRAARDLEDDTDVAGTIMDMESIEHRCGLLTEDAEVFKQSMARFGTAVERFIETVEAARESHHRVVLAKRVEEAMARFGRTPAWEVPGGMVSSAYEGLKRNTEPGTVAAVWKEDYRQLQNGLRFLCGISMTISGLEKAIDQASKKRSSAATVKQLEEDVQEHRTQVAEFNARHASYLRQAEEFLERVSAHKATPPGFSPDAVRLLGALRGHPYGLFHLVRMGAFNVDGDEDFQVSVADRVAVFSQLAREFPEQRINSKSRTGDNLLHALVKNNEISEYEKVELARALVELGVPLNEGDQNRRYAMDSVLGGDRREPELIRFLQGAGARLSPRKGLPVAAHFAGVGGSVVLRGAGEPVEVDLEGLSPRIAQFFVDPVVEDILAAQVVRAAPSVKESLAVVSKAYSDLRDIRKFISVLRQGKGAEKGKRFGPVFLSTGWTEPSGHAIGFVFNQEAGGSYLYACNAGDSKAPLRSIVKYRVEDFDKAIEFFRGCERNGDRTRRFYTGTPAEFGFERCGNQQQVPDRIDKSSQKRGNCPMASRKACLRAALWSVSRDAALPPEELRATYKELTSLFRQHGVNQVIADGSMEMMGKTLVSMVTKFDRPMCKESAYGLVDEILRAELRSPRSRREVSIGTEPPSTDPVARIKLALQITKQDIGGMTTKRGESLSAHAHRKGNSEAGELLRALTDGK